MGKDLALIKNVSAGSDEPFRIAVELYVSERRQHITVSRIQKNGNKSVEWEDSNDVIVNEGRRPVVSEYEFEKGRGSDSSSFIHLTFTVGVRPPFLVALFRAWTFSILDYIKVRNYRDTDISTRTD